MSNQIELRHLTYFLAVAEELHFRKAAEKLFISQPGLSRQIKQMEDILETQLFERNKKKVSLTPAGYFLKKEVEFIFNHLEKVERQLKLVGDGNSGELRIGFLGSAMQKVIPQLLLNIKETYPKDMGFVRVARVPNTLHMKTVFKDTFSLVLPERYPLLTREFKGMHQFANDDFILFNQTYSPLYYETIMSICQDAGFAPKVSHKSVHAHTIFKLVENHMGIAIVPTALQNGFQMRVKFIELKNIPQRAELSVIWKKEHTNPVLKNCMELLIGK
ncbi:LysR family transcriptional regulator [Maribacter arcticus]|uniref:LysR family transcriptional regulator n=1 Tax=Maribacter arcticus TaxID=561365 RepID=UPI0030D70E59